VAYQSLYRRYRSKTFAEVLGQPHVTTALKAAVAEGRYGHAYLFSGPRGTGKTSTARVLAKALNCENLTDGEPCGTCESCVAIEGGKSFDLHELDAASHNKVDDIRDLISKVQLGSPGRTKVYILDEVHMLSSGAENALLKTLEEPPDHVVFVLATTEPQKVVPTIRSRTQHFEFHLLPADVLAEHVRSVIADAGLGVGDEAVDYVLRQGGGSARDTLSALDLVAAAGGLPEGTDTAEALVRAIGAQDSAQAIAAIQQGLELGREPRTIGEDTLDLLRNAFLASMGAPLIHLNDRATAIAEELASELGPAALTRSLEAIGQTLVEMRQAPDPRIPLEVTLLRLTRHAAGDAAAPATESGGDGALVARVEALEARIAALEGHQSIPAATGDDGGDGAGRAPRAPRAPRSPRRTGDHSAEAAPGAHVDPKSETTPPSTDTPSGTTPTSTDTPSETNSPSTDPQPEPASSAATAATAADELSVADAAAALRECLETVTQKVRARFKGGQIVGVDGSTVRFGVPNPIHRDRCNDVKGDVEAGLSSQLGRAVTIEVVLDEAPIAPTDPAKLETKPAPSPIDRANEEAEIGPVTELADADDGGSNRGVDRITKAFPGSQVIDAPSD